MPPTKLGTSRITRICATNDPDCARSPSLNRLAQKKSAGKQSFDSLSSKNRGEQLGSFLCISSN
jgi:hypothetical protein